MMQKFYDSVVFVLGTMSAMLLFAVLVAGCFLLLGCGVLDPTRSLESAPIWLDDDGAAVVQDGDGGMVKLDAAGLTIIADLTAKCVCWQGGSASCTDDECDASDNCGQQGTCTNRRPASVSAVEPGGAWAIE